MCTTISDQAAVSGSGKGGQGWFRLHRAVVGYDHPSHVALEHAILLDLTGGSPGDPRLAVELSLESARRLADLLAETVRQAEQYERTLDTRAQAAGTRAAGAQAAGTQAAGAQAAGGAGGPTTGRLSPQTVGPGA